MTQHPFTSSIPTLSSVVSRSDIPRARRVVVKVGSSSISGENAGRVSFLIDALASAHQRGVEIVLVSSGAIATGLPLLNLEHRPADLATKQAAAAVGQNALIHRYQESLDRFGIVAAQVLLTEGDLRAKVNRANARRALERLLELRVLPIVNENDTVATDEIRFGDNDELAARVARLLDADLLILLSDVDSLYTKPPWEGGAERIVDVAFGDTLDAVEFGGIGAAGVGTGGARTKVSAARLATTAGTPVLMTSAAQVNEALRGDHVGTWFAAGLDAQMMGNEPR